MSSAGAPLLPSSSLPPLRSIDSLTEDHVFAALKDLQRIYCPLSIQLESRKPKQPKGLVADSGYVSSADDGDDGDDPYATLRADGFEQSFVERWLMGLIARVEELTCLTSDESRQRIIDQASQIIESFYANTAEDEKQRREELADYSRDFSFEAAHPSGEGKLSVEVRLNDGLAGQDSEEADDVGLQSWGASVVFSDLICSDPGRFGLSNETLGSASRIIDLGAGTGLVSFVLGKLLPQIDIADSTVIATDYHPAVMDNLRANVLANFPENENGDGESPVQAATLDWAAPSGEPPLHLPADILFATDVVYAAQHAAWLRDCATGLLSKDGVFWLFVTIRDTGRFDGVSDTVSVAFAAEDRPCAADGRRLTILNEERLEKRKGIGRGDEAGYRLFRIGWT